MSAQISGRYFIEAADLFLFKSVTCNSKTAVVTSVVFKIDFYLDKLTCNTRSIAKEIIRDKD